MFMSIVPCIRLNLRTNKLVPPESCCLILCDHVQLIALVSVRSSDLLSLDGLRSLMYQHRHKTHRAGLQGFWYPNFELVESNSGTFDWTVRNSKNGPKALNSGEAPLFLIAIPGFQHICELPDLLTRESVATQLFRLPAASLIKVVSSQYFQYYDDEIKQLQFGIPSQRQTAGLALRTHEDVAYVVDVLRRNGDQDRPKIRELLRDSLFPEASNSRLDRAVNVSLRLWLMINIREQEFKSSSTLQRPCVQWNNESTLDTFLSGLFPKPRWEATPREGKYDPQFTAAFMVNVCGLKLKWTTSLEDHLRLDRKPDSRTLWIFPFKFHLRNLLRSQECLNDNEK